MNAYPFSTDVLDRMRRYPNTAVHAPDLIREGIAEIERLRAQLAEASDEAQLARSTVTDLTIEVERLRDELSMKNAYESCKTLTELRQRVETLTAERDEARQETCRMTVDLYVDESLEDETLEDAAMIVAERRGWDCFKEDRK